MRWRRVEDELPEQGVRVLVFERGDGWTVLEVGQYLGLYPENWQCGDCLPCTPTHWMPLPAPPGADE